MRGLERLEVAALGLEGCVSYMYSMSIVEATLLSVLGPIWGNWVRPLYSSAFVQLCFIALEVIITMRVALQEMVRSPGPLGERIQYHFSLFKLGT